MMDYDSVQIFWAALRASRSSIGGDRRSESAAWSISESGDGAHPRHTSRWGSHRRSTHGGDALAARLAESGAAYIRSRMNQESFARRILGVPQEVSDAIERVPIPHVVHDSVMLNINQAWVDRLNRQDDEEE